MNIAETLAQIQLNAYNNRDIDAFMEVFSKEVRVYNFPNTLISDGWDEMYNNYKTMFARTPNLLCELKSRIVINNKVIDEEYVRKNNTYLNVVAVYLIENNKISSITFIK